MTEYTHPGPPFLLYSIPLSPPVEFLSAIVSSSLAVWYIGEPWGVCRRPLHGPCGDRHGWPPHRSTNPRFYILWTCRHQHIDSPCRGGQESTDTLARCVDGPVVNSQPEILESTIFAPVAVDQGTFYQDIALLHQTRLIDV
jgi:hypothetical protein